MSMLLLTCCSGGKGKGSEGKASDTIPFELPLPVIPDSIDNVQGKIGYAADHFWDLMDFRDTLRSLDDAFMEQNFANFALILSELDEPASRRKAAGIFLTKASADKKSLTKAKNVARLYLADPNSPMRSEEVWIDFLEVLISSDKLADDTEKLRLSYELGLREINRPGMEAEDFEYVTRGGTNKTLLRTESGEQGLIVVFYDPECDHCKEIIGGMAADSSLKEEIADGMLTVLAIDVAGDRKLWDESTGNIPADWIDGFNTDDLREREAYWLPALPSIYVLDTDKTVILKDADLKSITL